MKLAFAIAIATGLHQAVVTRADCDFGSNYTSYFNSSEVCSFDVGIGFITHFSESNTISSGDTNVTTTKTRRNIAIWKVGDKDSTVQCYSDISADFVYTTYPDGSTFDELSGDFIFGSGSNDTVADGVSLSSPGFYYVKGGLMEVWISNDGSENATKAEGDITDLCEVLGGGAAPAPTPKPPTTEAPSDCEFGSNYTSYYNGSDYCSFDIGIGIITDFSESNTTSSGDTNVTARTYRGKMAFWKVGDKDSTLQCYSDVPGEYVSTSYPNGSTFVDTTGDFSYGVDPTDTVEDGVPLSFPGLYYFKGGRLEIWINSDGNGTITKAEGDITDLCEVLGGGAAPAPTPTPPTTEAPSSGKMAAVTIFPCVSAAILNYFFN